MDIIIAAWVWHCMYVFSVGGGVGDYLRLSQFVPQTLDGLLLLIHLRSAVLQLCLQQLRGPLVVGHPAVSCRPSLLQLCHFDAEGLAGNNRKKPINELHVQIWIQRATMKALYFDLGLRLLQRVDKLLVVP